MSLHARLLCCALVFLTTSSCTQRKDGSPSSTSRAITSTCGDGLIAGDESCDDGNSVSGDGCSANSPGIPPSNRSVAP